MLLQIMILQHGIWIGSQMLKSSGLNIPKFQLHIIYWIPHEKRKKYKVTVLP